MTDPVAVFLFIGIVACSLLAGADFSAGFWDVTAGGACGRASPGFTAITTCGKPVWRVRMWASLFHGAIVGTTGRSL